MISSFKTEDYQEKTLTLYHCTDTESAYLILADQRFIRGSDGYFGGGMYYAESVQDAERKAHKKGVVLSAEVRVGKALVCDQQYKGDYQSLKALGCNSIKGTCLNGTEWVVFNNGRIRGIKVVKGINSFKCSDNQCARFGKYHYGGCGKVCDRNSCLMYKKKHRAHCKTKDHKIEWKYLNE
jgi:hypothetical protein